MGFVLKLFGFLAALASFAGVGLVWVEAEEGGATGGKTVRYQFVDDTGNVRIVDSLDEVPAEKQAGVGRIEFDAPAGAGSAGAGGAEASTRDPIGSFLSGLGGSDETLVVYTTQRCGYSKKLLAELDDRGVAYQTRDIDYDPVAASELQELTGRQGVPVSVLGDEVWRGYNRRRARELDRAVNGWWPF